MTSRLNCGRVLVGLCNASLGVVEWSRRRLGRPPVHSMSTQAVQAALAEVNPSIVLVDVRSAAERSVSGIPGAVGVEQFESDPGRFADKVIVPYCTIGGRSYLYARKLTVAGIPTRNYQASILGWCWSGGTLQSPGGEFTSHIHPYWSIFQFPADYDAQT